MCWLIYTSSYVSRYSYNSNIVAIKDFYGVTNSVTGLVSTCFFFAYGVGQVVNGLLCKRYNKKLVLSFSLIASSIINLILFTRPPMAVYKYVWFIHGMALSVLWSTLILTLSQNLDDVHLSRATVIMSSSVAVGTIISYGSSSLFNAILSFKYAFLLGGIASGVVGIIWLFTCDKFVARSRVDVTVKQNTNTLGKRKTETIVIISLVLFGLFMLIDNLVKDGLNTWVPQILKDTYHLGDSLSIILTLSLPILGLFGSIFVVLFTRIIKDSTMMVGVLFLTAGILIIAVAWFMKGKSFIPVIGIFGVLSLLTHSINNFLTSFLPLKMRDKFNSGILAGLLNGCGYVGSTISSFGLGVLADKKGWNSVIVLFMVLCFTACGLSIIWYTFNKFHKKKTV